MFQAQPASAATSGQGLAANPWIMEELGSTIATNTARQSITAIDSGFIDGSAKVALPKIASSGQVVSGTGLAGRGKMLLTGVGAVVGLGAFPAIKGLFGSGGSTAALPSIAGTPSGMPAGAPQTQGNLTVNAGCVAEGITAYISGPVTGISSSNGANNCSLMSFVATPAATPLWGSGWFTSGAVWFSCSDMGTANPRNFNAPTASSGIKVIALYATAGCGGPAVAYATRGSAVAYGGSTSTDTNPDRWITTTIQCKFPDGTITTRTGNGATFKRATGSTGVQEVNGADDLECPDGSMLIEGKAEVVTAGSPTKVQLGSTYTSSPALTAGLLGEYSDCLSTVCSLHVVRLVPELSCDSRAPAAGHPCRDWATSSDLATNWQCRYGTHVLAMSACSSLANAYKASPVIAPNTGTGAAPAPVGTDIGEDPTTSQTPGLAESGCVPSGLGLLNPFWVFKGVGCAIKWAFVPSATSMQTAVNSTKNAWLASPPGAFLSGFGSMIGAFGSLGSGAAGCDGPALSIPPLQLTNWHPISACAAPMSTVAGIVKLLLTVMVYVGAAVVAARLLAASFGLQLPAFNGKGDD